MANEIAPISRMHAGEGEEVLARSAEVEAPPDALLAGTEHRRGAQEMGAAEQAEERLGEDDRGEQRDDRPDARG